MPTLDRQTIKEINTFKTPDVPNNAPDAIEAARVAARAARNGNYRKQASELSKTYFDQQVKPALDNYEQNTGVKITPDEEIDPSAIREGNGEEIEQSTVQPSNNAEVDDSESDELDEESLNVKVTRLINGKKVTKTVGEWLVDAEKIHVTPEPTKTESKIVPLAVAPVPVIQPAKVSDEELANFVKSLQEGTSEDAVKAARKFLDAGTQATQKAAAELTFDQNMRAVYNEILTKNPDISGVKYLWDAACTLDGQLSNNEFRDKKPMFDEKDPFNNFRLRFQSCIDSIRKQDEERRQGSVNASKKKQLLTKKDKLKTVASAASARVVDNQTLTGPDGAKIYTNPNEYHAAVEHSLNLKRRFQRGEITREQYDKARRG